MHSVTLYHWEPNLDEVGQGRALRCVAGRAGGALPIKRDRVAEIGQALKAGAEDAGVRVRND